jgi:ubiquinone/menaquinone biosynthesis C-methylase UbiE
MFDRYTESAKRAIFFARFEASRFASAESRIEVDHLLLGSLRERHTPLRRLLNLDQRDRLRTHLEAAMPTMPSIPTSIDLPLSAGAEQALRAAEEEADRAAEREIAPEHLLAGILRQEDTTAARLLREFGVRLEEIRGDAARSTAGLALVSAPARPLPESLGVRRESTGASTSAPDDASAYDRFAAVYNRHMGEDFTWRALPVISRLLLAQLRPGAGILDVCCGSGQMARALSARGYRVTGCDTSEAMLRYARQNAPGARFLRADAKALPVTAGSFQAAISTFNSLAHMNTVDDLSVALADVYAALADDGAFVFDLTMEAGYTWKWRGSFTIVEDETCCVVRPSYNALARLGHNNVTVFLRGENGAWERSDFDIAQRCYTNEEIHLALARAGFADVATYDAGSDLDMAGEFGRSFFVARKLSPRLVAAKRQWDDVT